MMTVEGNYDEALERFHATGPEFQGWLSNHGPMVIEAMDRRGAGGRIHRWTDDYLDQLDDRPRSRFPIGPDEWRDPLGDPARTVIGSTTSSRRFASSRGQTSWPCGGHDCCRASLQEQPTA